jgi:site-specific DNA-methyltransferase (adenine-specific)
MGSGTTAVAAKALGRDYIGFEISEKYVELANARIEGTQVKQKQDYSQLDLF